MTNHVTPQTATRLKQAGFTQPEQKPGQFWYLQNRLYFIVAILTDTTGKTAMLYEVCEENRDPSPLPVRLPFSDAFVYAPGVGEILQAIGGDYALCYPGLQPTLISTKKSILPFLYKHISNPAEVAAAQWIEQKQKQP